MKYAVKINNPQRKILFSQYVTEIKRNHLAWYDSYTLIILLSGTIEVTVNGVLRTLHEDDIVLINPNQTFSSLAQHKSCFALTLYFSKDIFERENLSPVTLQCITTNFTRNNAGFKLVRKYAADLMRCCSISNPSKNYMLEGSFLLLISALLQNFSLQNENDAPADQNNLQTPSFEKIIGYINLNYKKRITLSELARVGNYNTSYISQLFRKRMNVSFQEYLTRLRLQSALADLNHTDLSIHDIAMNNGYADVRAFCSSFKAMFQKTPYQYKMLIAAGDFAHMRLLSPRDQLKYKDSYLDKGNATVAINPVVENKLLEYSNASITR